ncbi:MAG: methyltransferase domain-containing protein [Calditrichaeota bacterium]|nr:MAG: methyltransferase domain-containing protein [Calditrichota bacterium]
MDQKKIRKIVQEAYGKIAGEQESCGGCGCGTEANEFAKAIGYSDRELELIPAEANLALSCGNPTALASLKQGEVVLDLGSGAGFDCFLAATQVGARGRVIGVDMTPEMIEKARANARKHGIKNVEFKLGEIENLPLPDGSVDVVISNCVINLSADKPKVFQEIYRVLKPGGRIAISDIALLKELPQKIQNSPEAYVRCVAGAIHIDAYKTMVEASGLQGVKITIRTSSDCCSDGSEEPMDQAFANGLEEDGAMAGVTTSVYVEGYKAF